VLSFSAIRLKALLAGLVKRLDRVNQRSFRFRYEVFTQNAGIVE
jgi:hypothetical protein